MKFVASRLCYRRISALKSLRASIGTLIQSGDAAAKCVQNMPLIATAFNNFLVKIRINQLAAVLPVARRGGHNSGPFGSWMRLTDRRKDGFGLNCPRALGLAGAILVYSDQLFSLHLTQR
jgi:hypothetical protein